MTDPLSFSVPPCAFRPVLVQCASTNDYAMAHPAPDTLYYAVQQAGGKGRDGRAFVSGPGGAYFSLCFYSSWQPAQCTRYPLYAGLAVAQVLNGYGVQARIKWPNDVMVGGKKITGILVERRGDFLVVGIGVNVANDLGELSAIATGLRACGVAVQPARVIADVADAFHRLVTELPFGEMLEAYRALCCSLGSDVHAKDGVCLGRAVALDDEGYLVVQKADGTRARLLNPVQ